MSLRSNLAIGLSTSLLVALPFIGAFAGWYLSSIQVRPTGQTCGMYGWIVLSTVSVGTLLGVAAGIGAGWLATLMLIRWANRCSLSQVSDKLQWPEHDL